MTVALQSRLFSCGQDTYTSDDYYTPAWVFERMGIRFDLDVCAPPGGIPWIPADRYFTQEEDGLAQEWSGRVWMNPPYSDCTPWVRKFVEHGNGVALLPTAKSYWLNEMFDSVDGVVLPPQGGEMHFHRPTKDKPLRIWFPIFLAAFGEECVEAISQLGRVRR